MGEVWGWAEVALDRRVTAENLDFSLLRLAIDEGAVFSAILVNDPDIQTWSATVFLGYDDLSRRRQLSKNRRNGRRFAEYTRSTSTRPV